ncbi:unnamed protein product [Rotaria sp. Silwood2]|nr:unnamed protein product [Rotaria sp. Silwood2]
MSSIDTDEPFNPIDDDPIYEREDIQKKAFTKWINNQLANSNSTPPVTNLFQDLRDGIVLLRLLEVLTGNEYKREIGKMRVHHIGNVNKVIAVLGEYGIKLLSISSNDIVDGNPKLTLALIWSIIQYWQGKDVLKSVVPNPQQANVEKFLLSWCQQTTKGYKGVAIKDFTSSWQDGLAFNALIHKFRPDLFDYEDILQHTAARNLEHAFSMAKTIFKIDRYLDVEVKTKYLSYDDQFKNLMQTGNIITKQLKDAKLDSIEHESSLKALERRWQELYKQIINCERTAEHLVVTSKFDEEFQALTKAINEYKAWIDSISSTSSPIEIQVKSKSFQSYNERLANLRRMANRIDAKALQRTDDLLRSWDETHSRLRERIKRIESMQQPAGTTGFGVNSSRRTGTSSATSPIHTDMSEPLSSATTTASNTGPIANESGNVFTLTNIYTFGDHGNVNPNSQSDKYRVKSFVEVFDPTSESKSEFDRSYNETYSSSVKRKIHTSTHDTHDYDSTNFHHHYKTIDPSLTTYVTGSSFCIKK